jgi:AsmA protein
MARAGIGAAVVVGVGLAAVAGLMLLAPPVDLMREQISAEVLKRTGRSLTIGSAGMSFSSGLGVALQDVTLSAPPGMTGAPLATVERIDVSLSLLPLLTREVVIERLTLVRPNIALRVSETGLRSWDFPSRADGSGPSLVRYAEARGTATDANPLPTELKDFAENASRPPALSRTDQPLGLERIALSDVRIIGGTTTYEDARTATRIETRDVDAKVSLPSLTGPLSITGTASMKGEQLAFDLRIGSLGDWAARKATATTLSVRGQSFDVSYSGRVTSALTVPGDGTFSFATPSIAKAAAMLGVSAGALERLGALSLKGTLSTSASSYAVSDAEFRLGSTAGSGTAKLDLAGARPRIATTLRFAALNLDELQSLGTALPPSTDGTPGRFSPRSIEDLLGGEAAPPATPEAGPGPRVKGFRQRAGNQWDVEAIDARLLQAFDADARIQVDNLVAGKLSGADIATTLDLKDGILRANVTDAGIAGGRVRGIASVDARRPSLVIGTNITGEGVDMRQLLEAAGLNPIDGKARIAATLRSEGTSEREIVSALSGKTEVSITDGALVGWDADAIVKDIGRGRMPPSRRQPDARTPFREFSGSFAIAQGVARTTDLKLDSATVVSSGAGTINLVDRNIDLLFKPRLPSGGIEIPVRVAGPWDDPKAIPDLAGAMNSPQAQEAMRHLREGKVDDALRSVLGKGQKADETIGKAKDLLRGILGR